MYSIKRKMKENKEKQENKDNKKIYENCKEKHRERKIKLCGTSQNWLKPMKDSKNRCLEPL